MEPTWSSCGSKKCQKSEKRFVIRREMEWRNGVKIVKTWSVKGFNGEVSSKKEWRKKWNEKCNKTWSWLKFLIRAQGRAGAGATDGMVGVSLENWGSGRKMKLLRKVKNLRKNETFEGKENVENSTTKKICQRTLELSPHLWLTMFIKMMAAP